MKDNSNILIEFRVSEGVAELTLNQPSSRNALTMEMRAELSSLVARAIEDTAVRAIIIAAKGSAFCAGGDLRSMTGETAASMLSRMLAVQPLIRQLTSGNTPVIAAVDGNAVGGGLSLAMACDIVVAGPSAKFIAAFCGIGLAPDLGLTLTLPARVGIGRARLLTMTNRSVTAREAIEWGLADVEAEDALEEARRIAKEICTNAPLANGMTKRLFASYPSSLEEALNSEAVAQTVLHATSDFREGATAFFERRPPEFKGK